MSGMLVKKIYMALDQQNEKNWIPVHGQYHRRGRNWPGIPKRIGEAGIAGMPIQESGTRLFKSVDYIGNTKAEEAFGSVGAMPGQKKWATLRGGFQKQLPDAEEGVQCASLKPVFLLNGCNG
jgi:L-rhamnose mutarotase